MAPPGRSLPRGGQLHVRPYGMQLPTGALMRRASLRERRIEPVTRRW